MVGHSIRLPDNIPATTTLNYLNKETKRPRGRQRSTWKKMMEKNLNDYNLNWESATETAKDGEDWKNCCKKIYFLSKNLPDIA